MWLLLLFVVYYVSLIITLICCTYLADSYFLVDLFLQHFPVVESSVTHSCLWQTFPLVQEGPVPHQLMAPLPQTLLSKALENTGLHLEAKFDFFFFLIFFGVLVVVQCTFMTVTADHTTGRACCHTCSSGCSALSDMPRCFSCL